MGIRNYSAVVLSESSSRSSFSCSNIIGKLFRVSRDDRNRKDKNRNTPRLFVKISPIRQLVIVLVLVLFFLVPEEQLVSSTSARISTMVVHGLFIPRSHPYRLSSSRTKQRTGVLQQIASKKFGLTEERSDLTRQQNHHIAIECSSSFLSRSFWMAQEFATTFQDTVTTITIKRLTKQHPEQLRIKCCTTRDMQNEDGTPAADGVYPEITNIWEYDGDTSTGFAELKELKQQIRDCISPSQDLGHSDKTTDAVKTTRALGNSVRQDSSNPIILDLSSSSFNTTTATITAAEAFSQTYFPFVSSNDSHMSITYCTGCRWLLRAAFVGQELMRELREDASSYSIQSLSLLPATPPIKGGAFLVTCNQNIVWDRSEEGRFPEIDELLARMRTKLEHKNSSTVDENPQQMEGPAMWEDLSDDDASDMRQYFGVF